MVFSSPVSTTVVSTISANYPDISPPDVTEEDMIDQALFVSVSVIQQALTFLADSKITSQQLSYPSKLIPGGSVGKHIRHAADHYNLLIKAVTGDPPHTLSYDIRVRDTTVETSPESARGALLAIIEALKDVVISTPLDAPVILHAITPFPAVMNTTFGRELWFASLHAIHHWSMIRAIAAEQGISADECFGVAPSTLHFRSRSNSKL